MQTPAVRTAAVCSVHNVQGRDAGRPQRIGTIWGLHVNLRTFQCILIQKNDISTANYDSNFNPNIRIHVGSRLLQTGFENFIGLTISNPKTEKHTMLYRLILRNNVMTFSCHERLFKLMCLNATTVMPSLPSTIPLYTV